MCMEESETNQVDWKRFRPELCGKDNLQQAELPAAYAVDSRLCELSPMLCWALVLQLSLSMLLQVTPHPYSCKKPQSKSLVHPVGLLFCCGLPIRLVDNMCVVSPQEEFCVPIRIEIRIEDLSSCVWHSGIAGC